MLSSSLPELPIESRLVDFLPAPATVVNVALAFTFFVTVQHCRTNPLTLAMNALGDLFSSTKPKEILVQVVSPTPIIKAPPTPTVKYRYQPESTSNIFCAVALCTVFVLVGALFIVLRKKSTASISSPSSSVNPRFDIGSAARASDNGSPSLDGDIPEHFGSGLSNLAAALINDDDNSDKNTPGFLEKFKMFLILFFILTSFTHGGRITQKIRSLAIRDNSTFSSNNATATLKPYFHPASELVTTKAAAHFDDFLPETSTGGNILASEIVETLTFNILYSSTHSSTLPAPSILSSQYSSGYNEKYDSISLLPLPAMTSNLTSAYPIGLSLVTTVPSPTTTSSSKASLDLAFEYIKFFILFFFFCIFIPILSFLMTLLPAFIDYVQFSKAISVDQRESPVMKFKVGVNEVVPAIEVVKNSKVDIDIVDGKVAPAYINKGKGKAIEATEEKDQDKTPEESLDPTDTLPVRRRGSYVRPPCRIRTANKRIRRAEKAAIEAALNAPFL